MALASLDAGLYLVYWRVVIGNYRRPRHHWVSLQIVHRWSAIVNRVSPSFGRSPLANYLTISKKSNCQHQRFLLSRKENLGSPNVREVATDKSWLLQWFGTKADLGSQLEALVGFSHNLAGHFVPAPCHIKLRLSQLSTIDIKEIWDRNWIIIVVLLLLFRELSFEISAEMIDWTYG